MVLTFSAINEKYWFNVSIIDANAEYLSEEQIYDRIKNLNPRLIVFVVYGQNVNAGTTNMEGAIILSEYIKSVNNKLYIAYIGSYVQALPIKALKDESSIDFVFTNEGVYSLRNILNLNSFDENSLKKINGIAFRSNGQIIVNKPEKVVPNDRMDLDLPGYAWDLLPFKNKPLDLYRAPMWHAEYDDEKRTPYAALHSSLGCQFKCSFCMINLINRNDSEEIGVSSNYSGMRY